MYSVLLNVQRGLQQCSDHRKSGPHLLPQVEQLVSHLVLV
jgi:hypothetical protein